MLSWIKNIIANLRARSISQQKLQTAAALQNEKYLHWAYLHGSEYLHLQIIEYLADIRTQTNYAFLLSQMKKKNTRKKTQLYTAILNVVLDDKIEVMEKDEMYLQQYFGLIENVSPSRIHYSKSPAKPIMFRDKLKDHLGMLEEMKQRNTFY